MNIPQLLIKAAITGTLVIAISEIARRSTLFAAIVASLPLTSVLAMVWLYSETKDVGRVSSLSTGIFWMVLPSLAFFLLLPVLIRSGLRFYPSLAIACLGTAVIYALYAKVLERFGVNV